MSIKQTKILLVGGGTLGSVMPLLAVAEKYPADYTFWGTANGPEVLLIKEKNIKFRSILSGKLRRYWDLENFKDLFKIKFAFWQSLYLLIKLKPDIILTAGSFVAVPVVYAAKFLRIPTIVHQQDLSVGLANKLMAPMATKITVTFAEQVKNFKFKKTIITGNPVRLKYKNFEHSPSILITGGGLGARAFNEFVQEFLPILTQNFQVHHILGKNNFDQSLDLENYHPYDFVTDKMIDLLNQADLVISRAGMSLITETAVLKKALILIPIPDSHQEKNAEFFARHNAAIYVKQGSSKIMARYLEKLLNKQTLREKLGENLFNLFPKNPVDNYIKVIEDILSRR